MTKVGQSSFRRILLSRLLLVSVPILLIGVYLTYRKARSAILHTARQNITESAIAKGKSISKSVDILKAELIIAANNKVFAGDSLQDIQSFLKDLDQDLSTNIQCIQIIDVESGAAIASNCGQKALLNDFNSFNDLWKKESPPSVQIKSLVSTSSNSLHSQDEDADLPIRISQLELLFCVPILQESEEANLILTVKSALLQQEQVKPGLLTGNTGVIHQNGLILAYPYPELIGQNIAQQPDHRRWKKLIKQALESPPGYFRLFSPEEPPVELLTGYTNITSPITEEKEQKWIILDITPLEEALAGLEEVRTVLLIMTCALIIGSIMATLYISRDLAIPLEKLSDTVFHEDNLPEKNIISQNFKIREYNRLAAILNEREFKLRSWGQELENAWKKADAADRSKNEFLMTISHELRTPLNGIIGSLRLVIEDCCDDREEEKAFLNRSNSSAVRLLKTISDILEIANMEKGQLRINLEKVNLSEVLSQSIFENLTAIKDKGLKFNSPNQDEPLLIEADPIKLKQVFNNIIDNAVKFTATGAITISTSIDSCNESSGQEAIKKVIVIIEDTGIGIDIDNQAKLFRPFVMVDGTTTRKYGGVGLGLAISRNLVELMGGTINISSPGRDKGVKVEIAFPLIG